MKPFYTLVSFLALLGLIVVVGSCAQPSAPTAPPVPTTTPLPTTPPLPIEPQLSGVEDARSGLERDLNPAVSPGDLAALTAGNRVFAFDLYHQLRQQHENLAYSPHSITTALSMAYAGARGATAEQLASVLHYTLPPEKLYPAFNALALKLDNRSQEAMSYFGGQPFQLSVANSVWGQQGHAFLPEYLDLLARHYGSGLRLVDFTGDSEAARQLINEWISQQTHQNIQDLFPEGAISPDTRLILANAVYFNASWLHSFDPYGTLGRPFTLLDGSQVTAPMMTTYSEGESFHYLQGDGYQAIEIPYTGEQVVMDILLPDAGQFEAFEASLDAGKFDEIAKNLSARLSMVILKMPRFRIEAQLDLPVSLAALGAVDAFDPQRADFSGANGARDLVIEDVVHKTVILVNEIGTEAMAGTVVRWIEVEKRPDPFVLTIDRPFVFVIRDLPTGEILFVGRVLNPVK